MGDLNPFDVELCDVKTGKCTKLASIKNCASRGSDEPRSWDAAYCDDHTVVSIANGVLTLVDAPSGKVRATTPAPKMTRVACINGSEITARTTNGKAKERILR